MEVSSLCKHVVLRYGVRSHCLCMCGHPAVELVTHYPADAVPV